MNSEMIKEHLGLMVVVTTSVIVACIVVAALTATVVYVIKVIVGCSLGGV